MCTLNHIWEHFQAVTVGVEIIHKLFKEYTITIFFGYHIHTHYHFMQCTFIIHRVKHPESNLQT